jgi:Putative beta-barrel porin 2
MIDALRQAKGSTVPPPGGRPGLTAPGSGYGGDLRPPPGIELYSRHINGPRPNDKASKSSVIILKPRRAARTGRILALSAGIAVACTGLSRPGFAATVWIPFATAGAEYNSNVFSVPSGMPPFASTGNTQLGDVISYLMGGVSTNTAWGADDLQLNLQGERFQYDHFTTLSHNEYRFGGKFEWHMGPVVDGTLSYVQARSMTPPADTLSDQLEIQVDRVATAIVRFLLSPQWRFDVSPRWHDLDSPLPGYPGFGLHETFGSGTLNYLGISKLTAGVRFEYGDGTYHGIVGATQYHQGTAGLTAEYAVTGFSSFNGQVGYTKRNSSFVNPADATVPEVGGGAAGVTSALTGTLGFHRQLSVKTSLDLRVFREVDSYVAGANSEIGTGGSVAAIWSPDVKFDFSVRYQMETESIQGDLAAFNVTDRTDHVRSAGLDVRYHILRWLTLRPYYSRDQRTSNYLLANYTMNQEGLELVARFDPAK